MIGRKRLSRRAILRGGAGSVIALPWLEAMTAGRAHAAPPPRLIVVSNAHGTFPEKFWPTPAGATAPTTSTPGVNYTTGLGALDTKDYAFSPILMPLAPHRNELTVLEGIDNVDGQEGHHNLGSLLTNAHPNIVNGTPVARGRSFDQVIAARQSTRVPSLQLGVSVGQSTTSFGCLSWYDAGKPAPAQNSVKAVFERLFGGDGFDATAAERLRLERKSVLDTAIGQASALARGLGAGDREKLDGYLTSFRDVEKRLTQASAGPGCAPAAAAAAASGMPQVSQAQIGLAVAALQCDLTRVITLQYLHEGSVARLTHLGLDEPAHTISHAGNKDAAGYEKIVKIHHWYATEVASLLARLKAAREGGGSLLDNTLVLWVNAMNKGNEHNNWNIPTVLAGNIAGTYRMGRFVRFARDTSKRYAGRNKFVRGRSVGDLAVTILRSFGVDVASFGDPYFNNGALDGALKG